MVKPPCLIQHASRIAIGQIRLEDYAGILHEISFGAFYDVNDSLRVTYHDTDADMIPRKLPI